MKRTPLPARSKPLRRRSSRKADSDRVLAVNREVAFKRDGYRCQLHVLHPDCSTDACNGPLVVHHIRPRSPRPDVHDLANLLTLSDWCHKWVHAHPADARTLGLLR